MFDITLNSENKKITNDRELIGMEMQHIKYGFGNIKKCIDFNTLRCEIYFEDYGLKNLQISAQDFVDFTLNEAPNEYFMSLKLRSDTNLYSEASKKDLIEKIKHRNIEHLYHFTSIINMTSILEKGLIPLRRLRNLNRTPKHIDESNNFSRHKDIREKYVHLYVEKINKGLYYKYFYNIFEKNIDNVVLFDINPKVIYSEKSIFLPTYDTFVSQKDEQQFLNPLEAFKKLYDHQVLRIYTDQRVVKIFRDSSLKPSWPTDSAAHIQVEKVDIKFIDKIILFSKEKEERVRNFTNNEIEVYSSIEPFLRV